MRLHANYTVDIYLISGFIAHNNEHCTMSQFNTIFDHHTNTIINFLFYHFDYDFLFQRNEI